MQREKKQITFNKTSGTTSKRNVNIRKIPLNSRKITDTNNSQFTRNFGALKSEIKIVRPSNNVHECSDLIHTYKCMSLPV